MWTEVIMVKHTPLGLALLAEAWEGEGLHFRWKRKTVNKGQKLKY